MGDILRETSVFLGFNPLNAIQDDQLCMPGFFFGVI